MTDQTNKKDDVGTETIGYPVKALTKGYYGGGVKNPDDTFNLAKPEDFGSWMMPIGWKPDGTKPELANAKAESEAERPELTAEALAAAQAIKADEKKAETPDGPKTFRGFQTDYDGIAGKDALDHAAKAFGHGTQAWNKLEEKDRKNQILGAVRDLQNAKQAEAGAV